MFIKPLNRNILAMKRWQVIGLVLLAIAAFGLVGHMDAEEEQRQAEQYCDMVKLWKESKGKAGWPAYDGERICK